jgi:hypothetical protein
MTMKRKKRMNKIARMMTMTRKRWYDLNLKV